MIAFTGRLLEEKGIIPLIESVEQLCAQRDDVYLFLAGDGDLNVKQSILFLWEDLHLKTL